MSIEFKIVREEIIWGGRPLILETGKVARQADGAVVATLGGSVVLCTVVCAKKPKEGINFFPLTVNYQEKTFAVGRIPGGFLKRESKPSEQETLTSRLIDRPIRPLFPDRFYHETQVICTVLSHDGESDLEVLSLIGASAALSISGAPFKGPVAAARVGFNDGEFVLNPTPDQIKAGTLDLVVAGTEEGVLMVESEAKELSEDQMLDAVVFGHTSFEPVLKLITKFKKKAGKKEWSVEDFSKEEAAWVKKIQKSCGKDLKKAFAIKDKQDRYAKRHEIEQKVREEFAQEITDELLFSSSFKKCEAEVLRTDILKNSKRVDGRDLTTVRPIVCETAILPQTHGSSLFTRGETQVLAVTTLGTGQDEQIIDGISGEYRERFMLHYNFPAYSVGETGRLGAPGRREIGHGRLAWRALRPMMPTKEAFPYTVRSVAEVTESNGSSSMATVCSTSLALMEAGVPLAKPVAGIAMGLIKEGKSYAVLSDILGDEDHLGDMDFKVAGTSDGVTALQMDIKITSITPDIMKEALHQARDGRLHILNIMNAVLSTPKSSLSQHAPKMQTITIPKDKIRDLIGPGGKNIRELTETTGAKVDIEEDGTVIVSAVKDTSLAAAIEAIKAITCPPEVGALYTGKVVKLAEFGAFVNFMGSKDGLVHISEISQERIAKVSDVLKVGQEVKVKVLGFDDRGKIKLTMKI